MYIVVHVVYALSILMTGAHPGVVRVVVVKWVASHSDPLHITIEWETLHGKVYNLAIWQIFEARQNFKLQI